MIAPIPKCFTVTVQEGRMLIMKILLSLWTGRQGRLCWVGACRLLAQSSSFGRNLTEANHLTSRS